MPPLFDIIPTLFAIMLFLQAHRILKENEKICRELRRLRTNYGWERQLMKSKARQLWSELDKLMPSEESIAKGTKPGEIVIGPKLAEALKKYLGE